MNDAHCRCPDENEHGRRCLHLLVPSVSVWESPGRLRAGRWCGGCQKKLFQQVEKRVGEMSVTERQALPSHAHSKRANMGQAAWIRFDARNYCSDDCTVVYLKE